MLEKPKEKKRLEYLLLLKEHYKNGQKLSGDKTYRDHIINPDKPSPTKIR